MSKDTIGNTPTDFGHAEPPPAPSKTSGDLFMEQGHLMGKLMANAEHYAAKPSKDGCIKLAADLLALARAVGLGHLIGDAPK